jgi:hypothetical protein
MSCDGWLPHRHSRAARTNLMINGKLSWTAGRRGGTSGRRQRIPRARATAECRLDRGGASPAHAFVLAIVVNRGPLGLAELIEIEGLNPTMLSRVVGRLDSSVWSGGGAIRTITALPGSRSPPTGRGLAAHLGGANRGHLRMRGLPSRRAGGCPGRRAARAGKPLRGPAGALLSGR